MRLETIAATVVSALTFAAAAHAEPMFLAKQYTRCSACHYSPTGGGLLTPYGRSLSHRELSTTGADPSQAVPPEGDSPSGEQAFLGGVLGDKLGPLHLGIEMRPARLQYSFPGLDRGRNIWMNADLIAAYQTHGWTMYGEVGRQPTNPEGWEIDSYEYWVGRQPEEKGFGFRLGRFLPAYGVRFADHTYYNRAFLGFDKYDQAFGVEVSHTLERTLLQVSLGPGRADSLIADADHRALTGSARLQFDVAPRTVVVASGLFRGQSDVDARSGAAGLALGFAPHARVTTWTQGDARFQEGVSGGPVYLFVHETAIEAYKGVWLKVSPQARTDGGTRAGDQVRIAFEADLLPRTHWNVNLSYYRDRNTTYDFTTKIFLAQFHLYL